MLGKGALPSRFRAAWRPRKRARALKSPVGAGAPCGDLVVTLEKVVNALTGLWLVHDAGSLASGVRRTSRRRLRGCGRRRGEFAALQRRFAPGARVGDQGRAPARL